MIKTLFELCFLFFLYSFTGWILEVIQAAFNQKRFVNRGFINSPLCISYGIGAVIITINTHEMTGLWIFLVAMIDATVIEWFGGHFWMVIFVFLIQSSGEFLDILVSDLQILSFLLYTK